MYPLTVGMVISSAELWDGVQAELAKLQIRVAFEQASLDDPVTFIEKVNRLRPDVVLLDPSQLLEALPELIQQVKAAGSSPHVIVIRTVSDPQAILTAIRAGAHEYVFPPIEEHLPEALERIAKEREKAAQKETQGGKVFAFLSVKGGCGATTMACHSAVALASMTGKSTLLADMDFASGIVRVLMQAKSRYCIMDAMNNVQRLDASYWHGLVSNGHEGLEVIASTPLQAPRRLPTQHEVRHVLRFARSQYDKVILDLGHGLEPHTLSAIEEADTLVLVTTLEMPALQQAKVILREIQDGGISSGKIRLVINRVPRRSDIGPDDVENVLATQVFGTIPNDFRALEEAYSAGRLLPENSHLRHAIERLIGRLAQVESDQKKKKFAIFGLSL